MRACDTGPMPAFTVSTSAQVPDDKLVSLYESVGWTVYANDPELLSRAVRNSLFVVTAWSEDGKLVGLARAISDDASICYLQDILVHPDFQGAGVGRTLFASITARFSHVRQTVLITDDERRQRAFYESLGLTEGSDFSPEPVRTFVRFS